jgi:hypothetical protein
MVGTTLVDFAYSKEICPSSNCPVYYPRGSLELFGNEIFVKFILKVKLIGSTAILSRRLTSEAR